MATHTDTASVTYGALERILNKKILDLLCPVGKDLILSYDLGDDYATKLAAMFPGTTWSQKTTLSCGDIINNGALVVKGTDTGNEALSTLTVSISPRTTESLKAFNNSYDKTMSGLTAYHSGLTLDSQLYLYHRSA